MKKNVYIIGISGGTGSGKTSLAKSIASDFNPSSVMIIQQDSYYKDLSDLTLEERSHTNFDHPNAMDFELMKKHLIDLSNGNSIEIPKYDFSTHTRKINTQTIDKINVIIFEGIFALYNAEIRNLMNVKIFVETPGDIRIIRRIKRDVNERKRSLTSVLNQYTETVRQMHENFVEKTKQHADIIIPASNHNKIAIDIIKTKIMSIIEITTVENQ